LLVFFVWPILVWPTVPHSATSLSCCH
jgi:hypothetical protein